MTNGEENVISSETSRFEGLGKQSYDTVSEFSLKKKVMIVISELHSINGLEKTLSSLKSNLESKRKLFLKR